MKITTGIKTVLLLCAGVFFTTNANAQSTTPDGYDQGFRLGLGISAGAPLNDPYKLGLGADARLQYDLSRKYSLTLTSGFSNLSVKGDDNDLGFIPVKAGFKAFAITDDLYLMGEIGMGFAVTNNYDKTTIILAPAIGYATKYVDISLRYEHYTDFPKQNSNGTSAGEGVGQIALRLAYGFKL
jgi:hypothetical protein